MLRVVLPPLSLRDTRVRLLAWSYLDAVEKPQGGDSELVSSGETGSVAPQRNEELWRRGSYRPLERAMESAPRHVRRAFWREHVLARNPFRSRDVASLAAIVALMPESIHVPADIAEAAGFLPSEAKVYSR